MTETRQKRKMNEKKIKLKSIGRIVLLIVISIAIGLRLYSWNAETLAGNSMPMPFGFGVSVVLSGSMEPELSVNDIVIVHEAESYEVDDVVVFQDGNSLVIHKIISIDGEEIVTKGVANKVADAPITLSDVKGKMIAHIPYVGAAARFLKTPVGSVLLIVAAIALFELPYLQKRKKDTDELEKIKDEIRKLKGE